MCCAAAPSSGAMCETSGAKISEKISRPIVMKPAVIILQAFVSLFTLHNEARARPIAPRADAS